MAYRFLLEVPESLAEAAEIAVDQTGDAQVLVARASHGRGVDDPYLDLTVAAHTLLVIDSLYDWFDGLGASRPDVRIVLHGGERHALEAVDRGRMVAMIRRDQPWVERTIPKIGEHEPTEEPAGYTTGPGASGEERSINAITMGASVALAERDSIATSAPTPDSRILAINYVTIQVNNLPRAESFYQEFFGMELLGRARRSANGTLIQLPRDFSWAQAVMSGELADITYFGNGALTMAAKRLGLAEQIGAGAISMISLGVDAGAFASLKGQALMRPLTILRSDVASFEIRDPFNVEWEIAVVGSAPLIPV